MSIPEGDPKQRPAGLLGIGDWLQDATNSITAGLIV